MSSVYSRKGDDTFSLEDSMHEGAGIEPASLSDNGEASPAGSERLRAEIISRAREAEEREREATERYKQLEGKYRQELALRMLAEKRSEEIEEEFKQRLGFAQTADLLRLETELTLAETKARLKQEIEALRLTETALSRIKEDARIQAQSSSRALEEAENYIAELEIRVQENGASLEEAARRFSDLENKFREAEIKAAITESVEAAVELAERRIAELEARFREAEERAGAAESNALALEGELISTARHLGERTAIAESTAIAYEEARRRIVELEANVREGDKKVIAAGDAAREMELLMREAEAREKEAEEMREDAEARLQLEVEMRLAAEQRAQALENKFKSELEMDWTRFQADLEEAEAAAKAREKVIAHTSVEDAGRDPDELIQQLYMQLEAERQARSEIERRLAESEAGADNEKAKFNFDAERRLAEMEAALKGANALRLEVERKLAEFVSREADMKSYYSAAVRNSAALKPSSGPRGLSKEKVKLAGYVAMFLLLIEALFFLLWMGLTTH